MSYTHPLMFGLAMMIHASYVNLPVYPAFIVFGEIGAHLCSWASSLRDQINQAGVIDNAKISRIFIDSRKLAAVLHRTSDLFAYHSFFMMSVMVLAEISSTYRIIAFFIDSPEFNAWLVFMIAGFVLYSTCMAIGMYFMTHIVQQVEDENKLLIAAISNITDEANPNMKIQCDQGTCSFNLARNQVLHCLKGFEGFSALDFFYLKKSLISSIFANFVTYLIIMLQFKVTEITSSK